MKKIISLCLVLVLTCSVFAGCGGKKTEAEQQPTEAQKATEAAPVDVTVEEAVLFEVAGVKAIVTGISVEPDHTVFPIRVENTSEKDVILRKYDYATVNGVPVYAAVDLHAFAGETVEKDWAGLAIMKDQLDEVGIQAIATVSMTDIELIDRATNEVLAKVSIEIVTSLGADHVNDFTTTSEVICEVGGVSAAYQLRQEGVFTKSDRIVFTNANEYDVSVFVADASGDFDVDASDSVTVPAGGTGFCTIGKFYKGSKDGKLHYEFSISDLNNNYIGKSDILTIDITE